MIVKMKLLAGMDWLGPFAWVLGVLTLTALVARGLRTLFPTLPSRESEEAPFGNELDDLQARYARGELSEVEFNAARMTAHALS